MQQDSGGLYNLQEVLVYMRISDDFYRRRGGMKYSLSILKFKAYLLRIGFMSWQNFIVSGLSHAVIAIIQGYFREWFYKKFLRR